MARRAGNRFGEPRRQDESSVAAPSTIGTFGLFGETLTVDNAAIRDERDHERFAGRRFSRIGDD